MFNVSSLFPSVQIFVDDFGMSSENKAVPPFLNKLYNMVSDHSTDAFISWTADGAGCVVYNQQEFAKQGTCC